MNHTARRVLARAALTATLCIALLAPSSALAAFTRPFLRQIIGTPTGSLGTNVGFSGPGGVVTDPSGDLWVGDGSEQLDEFNAFGVFIGPEPGPQPLTLKANMHVPQGSTPPGSLSMDYSTGDFYVTGPVTRNSYQPYVEVFDSTGTPVSWNENEFGVDAHVAVDNSCAVHEPSLTEATTPKCKEFDPSNGDVYVSHGQASPEAPFGDGLPKGIEKFSSSGACTPFTTSASYITGCEIIAAPAGSFKSVSSTPGSVAVDPQGNIYVVAAVLHEGHEEPTAVYEYRASGLFVGSFDGQATPGLGGSHTNGGFGAGVNGVAVDPSSGHVLVSVSAGNREGGAVDEFDSSGRFLNQIREIETAPGVPAQLSNADELTVDSHSDLYVVDPSEHAVDVFGPGHFLPNLRLAEASERKPTTALLSGSVNPESLPLTKCVFQYVTDAAFQKTGFSDLSSGGSATCVPAAGAIPADSSFHPVEAKIAGLASGATYRYRLLATSSGALGGEGQSAAFTFTAPGAPVIDSTAISNLSSTFADLNGQISPLGADTTYLYQYVEAAHYEPKAEDPYAAGASVPIRPEEIGSGGTSGDAVTSVLQHIGGLTPGATYHFRVLASNEVGTTFGPDASFTTLPQVVPGLPDNRAYELLTPPNKGSAADMFATAVSDNEFQNLDTGYAAGSGNGFMLETKAAFGPFPASLGNVYIFSRTPSGWTYTSLASSALGLQSIAVDAFDPFDFSQVAVSDFVGSGASAAGISALSLVGPPGGGPTGDLYTTLHADAGEHPPAVPTEVTRIVGASQELSHVILQSTNHTLDPVAEGQDEGASTLYEYSTDGLKAINVTSSGKLLGPCGAVLGQGGNNGNAGNAQNAVSADVSRVIFTAPDPFMSLGGSLVGPGCWDGGTFEAPQIYQRSGGATLQISAPEAGVLDPTGRHLAIYVGASSDHSRVFFLTESELTKDDEGIHDPELYEWRAQETSGCAEASGCLARISRGESGNALAGVATVPAVAADGSAVYFTATGRLTSDAPAPGMVNGEAGLDLYRYDTATRATAYIATVGVGDYPSGAAASWWAAGGAHFRPDVGLNDGANWTTTPDGRYLLFAAAAEVTGYRTVEAPGSPRCYLPETQGTYNGHCDEVYRYDSATGDLACLSCNPSGAAPVSNAGFADRSASQGADAGQVRAISDDGSYVFFDTADALVPTDGNRTLDVYEWHGGAISLISSGNDSAPSYFLGSSPDGTNAFFGTHARLVPRDTDSAGDLYDARVCSASEPCVKPPAGETAQCEGDACQNSPGAPIDATPASLTFSGAGNLLLGGMRPPVAPVQRKAIKCSKGKKLSHGKCVKTRSKKKSKKKGKVGRASNNRRTKL